MMKKLYSYILRTFVPGKTLLAIGFAAIGFRVVAVPVTVQETGIGANEIVNITSSTLGTASVYAGIIKLTVNGVATDGFCIDPFHWSITGPQGYSTEALADAPKAPVNGMGAANALKIEQLWARYYASNMSNQDAAGLQIAIWEIVGGVNFYLNSTPDYGAAAMLAWVNNNPDATAANLIAVTGPGQDYVIPFTPNLPPPSVPDGGSTILLLSAGLGLLIIMRRKLAGARH